MMTVAHCDRCSSGLIDGFCQICLIDGFCQALAADAAPDAAAAATSTSLASHPGSSHQTAYATPTVLASPPVVLRAGRVTIDPMIVHMSHLQAEEWLANLFVDGQSFPPPKQIPTIPEDTNPPSGGNGDQWSEWCEQRHFQQIMKHDASSAAHLTGICDDDDMAGMASPTSTDVTVVGSDGHCCDTGIVAGHRSMRSNRSLVQTHITAFMRPKTRAMPPVPRAIAMSLLRPKARAKKTPISRAIARSLLRPKARAKAPISISLDDPVSIQNVEDADEDDISTEDYSNDTNVKFVNAVDPDGSDEPVSAQTDTDDADHDDHDGNTVTNPQNDIGEQPSIMSKMVISSATHIGFNSPFDGDLPLYALAGR